jgi:hypothetical protein
MGCHCEEQSDEAISLKNEIATPFGLAMTRRVVAIMIIRMTVTKLFFDIVSLNFLLKILQKGFKDSRVHGFKCSYF